MSFPSVSRLVVVCALLVNSLVSLALWNPQGVDAATLATTRLRIGVVTDGIVRIVPQDFSTAGVDPVAVNPLTFAMTSLGQSVAIRVTGEADGHFDAGDQIEFFGERLRGAADDEKYTDERVYWLEFGGAGGPRVAPLGSAPQFNLTPPTSFPTTIHAEQRNIYSSLYSTTPDTQDTWYWDRFQFSGAVGTSVTRAYPYTVPDPAPGFPATLKLEERARAFGNHRTTIALAGTSLTDQTWSGNYARQLFTVSVPAGLLTSGTNAPSVGAVIAAGMSSDDVYVNYWDLDYRRLFRAWQGQLDFTAEFGGTQEFLTQAWTDSSVAIWDISNPLLPKYLTDAAATANSGAFDLRFRVNASAGNRFWLQRTATVAAPASMRIRSSTAGLRNPAGGADAVIVSHSSLLDAANALAAWHAQHGRRALVVDVQDVYDEFNNGIFHPKAIREMMSWAQSHWVGPAPAYLTLLGDGNHNFKNDNVAVYGPSSQLIPPFMGFVDPYQGEAPADSLFADLTGDGLPDFAVGRIPVNNLTEAWAAVNKIIHYDETVRLQPWQQRSIFVADVKDLSAGDFPQLSDAIIADTLPSDQTAQRIYLPSSSPADVAATKAAIAAAINAGAFMIQYTGHGASWRWSYSAIWSIADVPGLTNSTQLPIEMTFDCLDGYFSDPRPGTTALSELMLRQPGGGTVAAFSSTGLSTTPEQDRLRRLVMDELFSKGVRELGQALTIAKQRFYTEVQGGIGSPNTLIYTMSLFGDPAMRLPVSGDVPRPPHVTAARGGAGVSLTWPAVTLNQRDGPTTVTTYGIWRSTQPYFNPDAANCNCTQVAETANLGWLDDGAVGPITPIGDVAHNYFYVVRARNNAGWSTNSNRTGEFDFALQPGS